MVHTHPNLAKEFHPSKNLTLKPSELLAGTNRLIWWKCSICDNEWRVKGQHRAEGSGCPYCNNGRLHSDGRNSIFNDERLSIEWCNEKNESSDPRKITVGSNNTYFWRCHVCNHRFRNSPSNRYHFEQNCGACMNNTAHSSGSNSIAITHPELANEIHDVLNENLDISSIKVASSRKIWWKCSTCDHEWRATPYRRLSSIHTKSRGCGVCSGNSIHSNGSNSMKNTHPQLSLEFDKEKNHPLTPENIKAGTNKKLWWICEVKSSKPCGHTWSASGASRSFTNVLNKKIGTGCPKCLKKSQTELYNLIGLIYPNREILFDYKHPELRFKLSNKKMELDIWIPHINLAIEYQGRQHYDIMEHWGGIEALEMIKRRDKEKKEKCKDYGIKLIEFHHLLEIDKSTVKKLLADNDIDV